MLTPFEPIPPVVPSTYPRPIFKVRSFESHNIKVLVIVVRACSRSVEVVLLPADAKRLSRPAAECAKDL